MKSGYYISSKLRIPGIGLEDHIRMTLAILRKMRRRERTRFFDR